jgi:transposase InsO family protein
MFEYRSEGYLLTVDYFSKFPEVCILPTQSSRSVITALKSSFSRFGIPGDVISDNGPQYTSREFSHFARTWGFHHTTSSPGYPQSNGQVERAIQSVKDLFRKCEQSGDDPSIALLNFRNTPLEGVGQSPAQLLMSRRLKSKLPILPKLLQPKLVDNAHEKLMDR